MSEDELAGPSGPAGASGAGTPDGSTSGGWVDPESVPEPGEGPVAAARRVLGRRRRNAPGGRAMRVNVRFTEDEYEALALRAAAGRMTVAHYVALRAMDAPGRAGGNAGAGGRMDLATMQAWASQMTMLRRELNRIGSNVNQIARLLNGTGEVARGAEQALAATTAAMDRVAPVADWVAQASGMVEP